MVVVRPFLIPRCQPSKLLAAVDQALHEVAFAIECPIKRSRPTFIRLARDRVAYAPPPQVSADLPAAIALVTDDARRSQPKPPALRSRNMVGTPRHHPLSRPGRVCRAFVCDGGISDASHDGVLAHTVPRSTRLTAPVLPSTV